MFSASTIKRDCTNTYKAKERKENFVRARKEKNYSDES
jgi:hypothetical protein